MTDLRTRLKIIFMLSAILVAVACFVASEHYSNEAQNISKTIREARSRLSGDDKLHADTLLANDTADRDTANKRGEQMFDLFTHVLTGFLGLAISASADLIGLAGTANLVATEPAPPQPRAERK